jgi:hypothetical protein
MTEVCGGARISACGRYRYNLWRAWGEARSSMTWIMCNPSTANADEDDPTIRKCMGFARHWGYEAISVVNLCALRATNPRELLAADDPVGPENERELASVLNLLMMPRARWSMVVVAWGNALPKPLRHLGRACAIPLVACLGQTADGMPRHPLMLPYSTPLQGCHA